MPEPAWLIEARKHLGVRETPGSGNNAKIMSWPRRIAAKYPSLNWAVRVFTGDAVPWCGLFVGEVMAATGHVPPSAYPSAKNWLTFGNALSKPAVGAIVVFGRKGGGHVGFVVGKDRSGNLMVLGGNQGDMVKVSPFALSRVIGYRWPASNAPAPNFNLPLIRSDGRLSTNER